jgi:hypothetical protein
MSILILSQHPSTVYEILRKHPPARFLFIFPHGLGDVINFLPLIAELRRRLPEHSYSVSVNERGLDVLDESVCQLVKTQIPAGVYAQIFVVQYPEPANDSERARPLLCNDLEFGIPDFAWAPLMLGSARQATRTVGVHFFGYSYHERKSLLLAEAEQVWTEIEEAGLTPFEVHDSRYSHGPNCRGAAFNKANSFRHQKPSLRQMMDKIGECSYFIGVDSGPLYLAVAILGPERCIGLQRHTRLAHYLPAKICTIETASGLKPGEVRETLLRKQCPTPN